MDSIRITLLRHGRSRADDEKVHEGRYDSPLTQVGLEQARRRLEDFRAKGFHFDCVVTSPLQRARTVAELMGEGLEAPVELDPDWMEVDNGLLVGLSFEEAAKRFPKPDLRGLYQRYHQGESVLDVHLRAARAVQALLHRGEGQYLVVAHGGILNAAMRSMLGIPPMPGDMGTCFAFADLGYAVLEYEPKRHRWWLLHFTMGFNTHV